MGQIQERLNIPGSTLSHHISRLVSVGLIKQERDSRTLYCIPQTISTKVFMLSDSYLCSSYNDHDRMG